MKFKILGSLLAVIAVTAGLLFYINANQDKVRLDRPQKSPQFLRCEGLVKDIQEEVSCEKKWEKMNEEFKDCETFPQNEPSETEIEAFTFRDIIFDIADCFTQQNKVSEALQVYERGLQFQDWMKDDHFNSYSAHFLINREKQLLSASSNPKCFNEKSFEDQIKKFTQTKNPELIRELLYSEDSLDTQVMASDAGGYLSYSQWKDVFLEGQENYKLQFDKKVGSSCYLTSGWDKDYPWRAFCSETRGSKKCLYLMTIYAGIQATKSDFEEFKKSNP